MVAKLTRMRADIPFKTEKSAENYIQWATELKITLIPESDKEENFHLVGPFNLESIDQYNRTLRKYRIEQWRSLKKQCNDLGILPPTFSTNSSGKPKYLNGSSVFSNKRNIKIK